MGALQRLQRIWFVSRQIGAQQPLQQLRGVSGDARIAERLV
jgi:hypothetical protein